MTSCFYTANWDHFYASWVGNLSALAWAPALWSRALNVDHFPVKWVPSLKIFMGCFTDPPKFWNLLDYMYKTLCNVRIPLSPTFVKKWGNAKAKTLARSASRSLTVSAYSPDSNSKLAFRGTRALSIWLAYHFFLLGIPKAEQASRPQLWDSFLYLFVFASDCLGHYVISPASPFRFLPISIFVLWSSRNRNPSLPIVNTRYMFF